MKSRLATLFILFAPIALASPPASPRTSPPSHRFFASASLTKAQVNSPTAADFGLFERTVDGKWQPFGPRVAVSGLTILPGNPAVMFVPSSDGVMRSCDGGRTWRQLTGWEVADVRTIVFDPVNPSLAYAATAWGPLRSTDGGDTWKATLQGLDKHYCQTLVADPQQAGHVLLGTENGLYVSRDAAQTWTRIESPSTTVLRLVRSTANVQLLLAGTQGRGAWLSRDNGASWSAVDAGSAQANLYAVAVSRINAATMAVGGWGVGVRVSTDGGASWTARNAGLPVKNVLVLAFDPDVRDRLWASTFEQGSFYSDDLGLTWKNGGLDGANGTDFIFIPASPR